MGRATRSTQGLKGAPQRTVEILELQEEMLSGREHERPLQLGEQARSGASSMDTRGAGSGGATVMVSERRGGGSWPAPGSAEPRQLHTPWGGSIKTRSEC